MKSEQMVFDFDEWRLLFEADPEEFEKRRREAVDSLIQLAPPTQQTRLRGLQWQIDAIRSRYKHPLVSATKLFQLMWDKVYGDNGLQKALNMPCTPAAISVAPTADVIKLRCTAE